MPIVPLWVVVLSALLTPTIAVLASVIAYRQWRTAQNKLKFDLFDRRLKVYEALTSVLGRVLTHGGTTNEDQGAYLEGIQNAKWLFGEEIREYLQNTVWRAIVDLELLESMTNGMTPEPERSARIAKQAELRNWFADQYKHAESLFSKYMSLGH